MSIKLDFLEGMKVELHGWLYESQNKTLKATPPAYPDIVKMLSEKDIMGGVYKTTSAVGAGVLKSRADRGLYAEDRPQEGFTVFGKQKHQSLFVSVPSELERDWKHRAASFMKQLVTENWGPSIEPTKDHLLAEFLAKGGYIAGDSFFDNSDSQNNFSTYADPKLQYDGKPVFNRLANLRTGIDGSTYYNGLVYNLGVLEGVTDISLNLALKMKDRLIANGRMENGNPFSNTQNLVVVCQEGLADKWRVVNKSTLNPDNDKNPINPMEGTIKKIVPLPQLELYGVSDFSVMLSEGKGIYAWFGPVVISYEEKRNPDALFAYINFDYMLTYKTFRHSVSANAPLS